MVTQTPANPRATNPTEARRTDPPSGRFLTVEEAARHERRRRVHQLLIVATCVSLLIHIGLMLYLGSIFQKPRGRPAAPPVELEFAILPDEDLIDPEALLFEDVKPTAAVDLSDLQETAESLDLRPDTPNVAMEALDAGEMSTLGGSGDGQGGGVGGIGGGAASTSFFGISGRGTRFAFLVDVSGSMASGRKLETLMRELEDSIRQLPDYTSVYVVLFSSGARVPPGQDDWLRAHPNAVRALVQWLRMQTAGGGTRPLSGYKRIFALEPAADIIYFMTDGELDRLHEVGPIMLDIARGGGDVTINTLAFGDESSQDLLKELALATDGVYRFVPARGP